MTLPITLLLAQEWSHGLGKTKKNIKVIALCCQIKKYNHLLYESHDDNVIGNGDDVEKIGDLEKQE